jgi:hypothetical protein
MVVSEWAITLIIQDSFLCYCESDALLWIIIVSAVTYVTDNERINFTLFRFIWKFLFNRSA